MIIHGHAVPYSRPQCAFMGVQEPAHMNSIGHLKKRVWQNKQLVSMLR